MIFKIDCFDAQGKDFKTDLELDESSTSVGKVQHARVIRVLLNHLRQATSSTKTRGQVSFSTRKPWKQKGTGRARVSAASSPLWRTGGVIFGPTPGCTRLSVNKKERRAVLGQIIKGRLSAGDFLGLELPGVAGSSHAATTAKFLRLTGIKSDRTLFLLPSNDIETFRRIQNLRGIEVAFFDQLGVLEFSRKGKIAFLLKDKELMLEAFRQWI